MQGPSAHGWRHWRGGGAGSRTSGRGEVVWGHACHGLASPALPESFFGIRTVCHGVRVCPVLRAAFLLLSNIYTQHPHAHIKHTHIHIHMHTFPIYTHILNTHMHILNTHVLNTHAHRYGL